MKLHLPKLLLTAVLATYAACMTVTAGTGWGSYNGGDYLYVGGSKGGDGINTSGVGNVTWDGEQKKVSVDSVNAVTKNSQNFGIVSDIADTPVQGTISELVVKNEANIKFCENPWRVGNTFSALTISKLEVSQNGEHPGKVSINNEIAGNNISIIEVSGVLSSVTNAGTLTLGVAANEEAGTAASTTNLAGTISNTGTMTVNGILAITDLGGFTKGIAVTALSEGTHGYQKGKEGYVITTGHVKQGSGFGVTLNGTQLNNDELISRYGNLVYYTADARDVQSTLYCISSTHTTAVEYNGTSGATASATGFWLENGTTVKLTGASNAGLTDRITIDAGDGGKATVMFANGKSQTYSDLGLGSLINVESGSYVLGIAGTDTVVTTEHAGNNSGVGFHRGEVLVTDGGKLVLKKLDGLGWGDNGNATPKLTIKDGTLALGARQTLANTTLDMQGGAVISALTAEEGAVTDDGNTPMLHTHSNFTWEVSNTGNEIESGVAIRVEKEATININSGGELTFKGTFTANSTTKLKKTGEGSLIFEGAKTAYGLIDVQAGSLVLANGLTTASNGGLTIAEDASLTVGSTIFHNGSGAVTLNGTITIDTSDLINKFKIASAGGDVSYSAETDGFMTTSGASYYLVEGSAAGSTLTTTNGYTLTYDNAGVTFKDSSTNTTAEYYVNTDKVQSADGSYKYKLNSAEAVLNVNGTLSNSRVVMGEGKVAVSAGNTLVIDIESGNVHDLLTTTTGDGTIKLSVDATLNSPTTGSDATVGTGTLIIEKAKLTFGTSDLNANGDKTLVGADISSFNAVELNNGHLYVNNPGGTIKNLKVTENKGTLEIHDMGQPSDNKLLTFAETTTLNGDLTVKSTYNAQIAFTKLAGSKNLVFDDDARHAMAVSINGAENYSGKVQVKQTADNLKLSVAANAGVTVEYSTTSGTADLTGIAAGNTVELAGGSGTLAAGTIAANVSMTGAPAYKVTATDGKTVTFAGAVSGTGNFVVEATANGANTGTDTYIFTGDVSGWKKAQNGNDIGFIAASDTNVKYEGNATTINSGIYANGGTLNATIGGEKAVTVNGDITNEKWNDSNGTLNLTVSNSSAEGVTFTNTVKTNTTTLAAGTKATFNGATTDLGDLTLAAGASVTTSGTLTLGNIKLDLTSYAAGNYTLVSATGNGSIIWNEEWTSTGTLTDGLTANVGMVNNVLQLTISAPEEEITSVNASVTGVVGYNADTDMLTLQLDQKVTSGTMVSLTLITDETILAAIQSELDKAGADDMFRITVQYDDTHKVVAESFDQVVFYNEKGQGYWGEMVDLGGNVGTKLAYKLDRIPEPTTTTLSLLALCGLAARRRRK